MGLSGSSKDVLVVATLNPHSLLVCLQAIGSNWKEVSAAAGTLLDWGPAVGPHSSQGTYGLVFAVSELPPHSSSLPSHSTLPPYSPLHSSSPPTPLHSSSLSTPLHSSFLPTPLHSYSPPHSTLLPHLTPPLLPTPLHSCFPPQSTPLFLPTSLHSSSPPHPTLPHLIPLLLPTSLHSYSPPHFTLPPPLLLLLPPPFMCIGSVLCH